MKNRKKGWITFAAGTLTGLAAAAVIWLVSGSFGSSLLDSHSVSSKLDTLAGLIEEEFLFETDEESLETGIYSGLIDALDDDYSAYYTEEEYESISTTNEGHYEGIGIVMMQDKETGSVSVAYCYEGGPAAEAGVQEGDVITAVDGEDVTSMEVSDIAALIKESGADSVTLTIYRETEESETDVVVSIEEVEIPSVSYEMLDDQIGYLAIYQFTGVTAEQFQEAYDTLLDEGMVSLIVDLRDNPGGLLTAVVDTLNCFMPEGLLVYTEDRNGERTEHYSEGESPIEIPLTVLVNENSASASEIFAGAVKDYEVGTLVGTTTYGKGIVQKTYTLSDGSVVKLTVSSYYTPNGVNIHGTGIEPDVEVEDDAEEDGDEQLEKAIEIAKAS